MSLIKDNKSFKHNESNVKQQSKEDWIQNITPNRHESICVDKFVSIKLYHLNSFTPHDDVIKWKLFRITGPLCGELTGHRWIPLTRPVTRSFDVFFDLRLQKRLSEQSIRRWFETPSRSLSCHCNVHNGYWVPVDGNLSYRPRFLTPILCRMWSVVLWLSLRGNCMACGRGSR